MSAVPDLDWQPSAALDTLRKRAEGLALLRQFFSQRQVMEVDTQLLSHSAGCDPFIDCFDVLYRAFPGAEPEFLYLQTSPEYAMKRLLSAGSGPIYQLGKVFRNGELGQRHNPEFTMLEWYRPGWGMAELMQEVRAVVQLFLPQQTFVECEYRSLFRQHLGWDPCTTSLAEIKVFARQHLDLSFDDEDRDTWLNVLMSHLIEPQLQGGVFVTHFPASQAALAKRVRDVDGELLAARFELYLDGLELANGYQELTDAQEQAARFQADQAQRAALNLPVRPLDQRLLAALAAGQPESAGVALGVDRLFMRAWGKETLAEVLPFAFSRA